MHYWPAESYVVKTFMENILHMPHVSLPSAHFDLFGKERKKHHNTRIHRTQLFPVN